MCLYMFTNMVYHNYKEYCIYINNFERIINSNVLFNYLFINYYANMNKHFIT